MTSIPKSYVDLVDLPYEKIEMKPGKGEEKMDENKKIIIVNGIKIGVGTCGSTSISEIQARIDSDNNIGAVIYEGVIEVNGKNGPLIFFTKTGLEIYNNREVSGAVLGYPIIVKGDIG